MKQKTVGRAASSDGTFRTSRRNLLGAAGIGALATASSHVMTGSAEFAQDNASSATPVTTDSAPAGIPVYPTHRSQTASPSTEISFRDVTAEFLGTITVEGSASGGHSGILMTHSDGRGVSFVPDASFEPGESVTVRTALRLRGSNSEWIRFTVADPAPLVEPRETDLSEEPETPPQTFRTRPDLLPPVIDITTMEPGTAQGYVTLGAKTNTGQGGAMIVDNNGDLVWFNPPANSVLEQVNDVRVQEYRGQPVLTWWQGASPIGHGLGHFIMVDSSYEQVAVFGPGNGYPGGDLHEFLLTPEGTALVIIYYPVRWDLSSMGGSADASVMDNIVQEIDVETGRVLFEWHCLDHIDFEESYRTPPEEADEPFDYFHLNSVERDGDGNYILSARNSFGMYKINGVSGEAIWRLNGKRSDFEMGPGTPFAWQHDARVYGNGELSLFDNAESDQDAAPEAWSRGMVLMLDETAMTATLVREYIHPTEILSVSQGNMQVLPNGNVFIGWGSAPVFSEHSSDGTLLFNGRFPTNENSYRAYRYPWSGHPDTRPDVVAESAGGSALTVYASWNGATEVASWQVLAGPAPDQLSPAGSAPRNGFETELTVETQEAYIAVQAMDNAGDVIGISEAVQPVG